MVTLLIERLFCYLGTWLKLVGWPLRDYFSSQNSVFRSGQIEEVCVGLTGYFNAMLGSQLLYKFERPQYEEVSMCYYQW